MKRWLMISVWVLMMVHPALAGDDKDSSKPKDVLQWRTFNDGFAEAKKSGKKVLVDVYTDWCVWCKRLDKNVYQDPKVSNYLRDHYVTVKLNPESKTSVLYKDTSYAAAQFAQGFGVTGYPTIIFFEPDGQPIDKIGGYVDASKFLPIVRFIGEDFFKKMSWDDFQKKESSDTKDAKKD